MQVIELVAEKTGKTKRQVLYYALTLGILFVVFGVGASIISNIVGVAYPAFMSFVALESEGTDDDKQWLTYWVVFGLFNIFDQIAGIILRFIPFYYVLKLAFLVYCFHPSTTGSLHIYEGLILPFVKEHKHRIDEAQKKIAETASKSYSQATEFVKEKSAELSGNAE